MKVLPVFDLLGGKVVHAIAGNRSAYEPISSWLCEQGDAKTLAANLATQYGFTHAYVADLNALQGGEPNWNSLKAIRNELPNLWVDVGFNHLHALADMFPDVTPILSLESITSPHIATQMIAKLSDFVFSVDMNNGKLLTTVPTWKNQRPVWMIEQLVSMGVNRLLVLDISTVGQERGPSTISLIESTLAVHSHVQIASGGGVRNMPDLQAFQRAGVSHVLMATGLHFGEFAPHRLAKEYID